MSYSNISKETIEQLPEFLWRSWQCMYLYPIIIIIGVTANTLALVILNCFSLVKHPIYFCLAVLSWIDSSVLVLSCARYAIKYTFSVDYETINTFLCKTCLFLEYAFTDFSVWLMVMITFQRYLIVQYPFLAGKLHCSKSRTYKYLGILVLAVFLKNGTIFWQANISVAPSGRLCHILHNPAYWAIFSWIDFSLKFALPYPVIVILNCAIYRKLRQANLQRHYITATIPRRQSTKSTASNTVKVLEGIQSATNETRRLLPLLLTLNVTFLVCYAPFGIFMAADGVFRFFTRFKGRAYFVCSLIFQSCLTLIYINHAINFFLYLASGKRFRHHVRMLMDRSYRNNLQETRLNKLCTGKVMKPRDG